jgi:hypothetical protein
MLNFDSKALPFQNCNVPICPTVIIRWISKISCTVGGELLSEIGDLYILFCTEEFNPKLALKSIESGKKVRNKLSLTLAKVNKAIISINIHSEVLNMIVASFY